MLYRCIYILINEEFVIRSHIQAYKGDANVYGPLWTPTCICAVWTFFPLLFLIFSFIISSQKDFIIPYIINNHMRNFPHHYSIMYYFTPPIFSCLLNILLLFVRTISPQFTCINRVGTMLYSTSIWVLFSLGHQLSKS